MGCAWEPAKAGSNWKEHGVDLVVASPVLLDELALTIRDDHAAEERFVTVGRDSLDRVLVVIHRWRRESIRLTSARRATPRERRQYEGSR